MWLPAGSPGGASFKEVEVPRLARRSFLTRVGYMVMVSPLLAACGQQASTPAPAKPAESKPAAPAATAAPAAKPSEAAKRAAAAPVGNAGGEVRVALESDVVTLDPPMFTDFYS